MSIKDQYRIIEFGEYGDERGNLVVAECGGIDVPFDVKRGILYLRQRFYHSKRPSR